MPNDSLRLLYICLSTDIHKLLVTIRPQYISNWNSRSSYMEKLVNHSNILSDFVFTPWFFLVSIGLTVINNFSACLLDIRVGRTNLGTFGTALISQLLWAFCILDAIPLLLISLNICHAIVFAVIWIIQVAIPVKQIIVVKNAFKCAIFVAFHRINVESSDSADNSYLSLSPREVPCRQSWWQRWSFRQFKCSCTIMLKEWPGCFDDLFRVRNVSYSCHLLGLMARFILCSM